MRELLCLLSAAILFSSSLLADPLSTSRKSFAQRIEDEVPRVSKVTVENLSFGTARVSVYVYVGDLPAAPTRYLAISFDMPSPASERQSEKAIALLRDAVGMAVADHAAFRDRIGK